MMNTVYRKYDRQFPRIQLPDVNTRRHDRLTIKNLPDLNNWCRREKSPNVRPVSREDKSCHSFLRFDQIWMQVCLLDVSTFRI